jgi:hypothetical protein
LRVDCSSQLEHIRRVQEQVEEVLGGDLFKCRNLDL